MYEVLFQSSYLTVQTFNVLLAIGLILTGLFIIRYTARQKMDLSFLLHSLPYLTVAGLVAGRAAFVLENSLFFENQWGKVLHFWDLGFSFFGVLYGVILMLLSLTIKKKESFWSWLDVVIFSMLIMMIFIHAGHFFNGQHYGLPTELPWGITFISQNIPYSIPIHPTQLYAMLVTFFIFVYSLKKDKRIHLPGVTGSRALLLYSLSMIGLDFLHGLPSQYVKLSFLALSVISFILVVHCSHRSHVNTNAPKTQST